MFNDIPDPVDKQMVVEFLCVVATILKRHPELQLSKTLDTQSLIDMAVNLYAKEKCTAASAAADEGGEEPTTKQSASYYFKREAVATTSFFFAKATVHYIMYQTNIIDFVEGAATSAYECPIQ